jgi:sodium-dependent dicarboxylate transporter 2/3/5
MPMKENCSLSRWTRLAILLLGPALALLPVFTEPPAGLSTGAWRLVGLTMWMALWWFTEIIPLSATALLPLVWMPLVGIMEEKPTAARYADPIIFLFLGGFLIAASMERWGLHRRIAVVVIQRMGSSPSRLVGGFMLATAFLSMWINNTSTAMMMYAVGRSVLQWMQGVGAMRVERGFGVALMLGIAYSASIGGVGTLIGTAPNALLAGYLRDTYAFPLDMMRWLWIGLPFVALMLPFTWFWLTTVQFKLRKLYFSNLEVWLKESLTQREPMGLGEKMVLLVFIMAVVGWLVRQPLQERLGVPLSDSAVAITAALLLFLLPARRAPYQPVLDWQTAASIPWGVLLLFGGGLALAGAFESTGLARWIGESVKGLQGFDVWLLVVAIATVIIFLTELTSNTAVAATFLPIMGAVADGLGIDPRLLTIPVAVGASAAFMLPIATPPNAIVFASGEIRITEMARAGFALNIASILTVLLVTLIFARYGLGIP